MKKINLLFAAALLSITVLGGLFPSTVSAAGFIGGRPALPREDEPRSQSIFIHTIKPGQTIKEKVLVSNQTDKKQTIELYPVDAIPTNTGSFTCKQRAEKSTDAGGWISLAKQEVTLDAGSVDIVDFTITAPKQVDVGEHNACIAFEGKEDTGQVSGNLRIRTRSAVRVALTIPGKLNRKVSITSFDVTQKGYTQTYSLLLKNDGNVSADTNVDVRLVSLFGGTVYKNGGQYPILPNNKLELPYQNDKSPFFGGWYFAQANIQYDKNASTWGTRNEKALTTEYAKNQLVFIWPQPLALVILIVLFVAIVWLVVWLVRQEKDRLEILNSWKPHKVVKGDTVQSLADGSGISWQKLARINKLKAPYALEIGSVIYTPTIKKKTTRKAKKPSKKKE